MHVVSFYTGEGDYARFAANLRASCERFGVPCTIDALETTGDWGKNNALKPRFVLEKALKIKEPVVWLDVDCELCERPDLFEKPRHDFMIYNFACDPDVRAYQRNPERINPAGGVFLVNTTGPGRQLLYRWAEACDQMPEFRDDRVLAHVWRTWKGPRPHCLWLPKSYNRMDSMFPDVKPVINHVYRNGLIFSGDQKVETPAPWVDPAAWRPEALRRMQGDDTRLRADGDAGV